MQQSSVVILLKKLTTKVSQKGHRGPNAGGSFRASLRKFKLKEILATSMENENLVENISHSHSPRPLVVKDLGLVYYNATWILQKEIQDRVINGTAPEHLLICSHFPVITFGSRGAEEELLKVSYEQLKARGIQVSKSNRGGSVTYHGPEQIILYPIIDLKTRYRDVGRYMRELEETAIRTLVSFDIPAIRVAEKTGVWTDKNHKICSIGVRLSRWVTMHGMALNLTPCAKAFSNIVPCGLPEVIMTSVEEAAEEQIERRLVVDKLVSTFCEVFASERLPDQNLCG